MVPPLALPLARRSAAACGPARLGAGPGPAPRAPLGRLPSRLSLRLAACDFIGMRAARRPGTNAPWLPCQIAAAAFPALARCIAPWLRDRAAAAARPRVGGEVGPPVLVFALPAPAPGRRSPVRASRFYLLRRWRRAPGFRARSRAWLRRQPKLRWGGRSPLRPPVGRAAALRRPPPVWRGGRSAAILSAPMAPGYGGRLASAAPRVGSPAVSPFPYRGPGLRPRLARPWAPARVFRGLWLAVSITAAARYGGLT